MCFKKQKSTQEKSFSVSQLNCMRSHFPRGNIIKKMSPKNTSRRKFQALRDGFIKIQLINLQVHTEWPQGGPPRGTGGHRAGHRLVQESFQVPEAISPGCKSKKVP